MSMSDHKPLRAGDHVFHRPSRETWVVAYVDGPSLAWCGWPAGEAKISDCTLLKRCSDAEHLSILRELATSGGRRAGIAQRTLAAFQLTAERAADASIN